MDYYSTILDEPMITLSKTRSVLKRKVKRKFKKSDTSKPVTVNRTAKQWEEIRNKARINSDNQ